MRQIIAALPLFLVGCVNYPASLVPLCTDAEAIRDDRIVGTWRLRTIQAPNERRRIISFGEIPAAASIIISRDSTSGYELVLRHEDTTIPFTCKLAKIDDQLFLDLQHTPYDDPILRGTSLRPHFLIRCTISDEHIRLTGCKPDAFRSILKQQQLPVAEIDSKTVYAGTSAQLRDLFSENLSELFPPAVGDVMLLPRPKLSLDNRALERSGRVRIR